MKNPPDGLAAPELRRPHAVDFKPVFADVQEALDAIALGKMVVVVDSPDRENEGDLVMAAVKVTPAAVNFMATHARGLICVSLTEARLRELAIPPMVQRVTDPLRTAFHVSVDHRTLSTTGISAADRAATILALVDRGARPDDFTRPGHIFPLAAKVGGVLTRPGHTEASVDLAVLAGCGPAGVICEIADSDGEMARMPALREFAQQHGLPLLSIERLIAYRLSVRPAVRRTGEADLPLKGGDFRAIGYINEADGIEHVALVHGDPAAAVAPLVRIHSECLTGDVFGSRRCDCGPQLQLALQKIVRLGHGAVVYVRGHEGRGIGLGEKLRAYHLQEQGLDTVEANIALGHPADSRDYGVAAEILLDLGLQQVRLLTNNPDKIVGLQRHGVTVTERVAHQVEVLAENVHYLEAKRVKMGHLLDELASPVGFF